MLLTSLNFEVAYHEISNQKCTIVDVNQFLKSSNVVQKKHMQVFISSIKTSKVVKAPKSKFHLIDSSIV